MFRALAYLTGAICHKPLDTDVLHTFACWNIDIYVSVCKNASASGGTGPPGHLPRS